MGPTLARLPVTKPVSIHNVLRKTEISERNPSINLLRIHKEPFR